MSKLVNLRGIHDERILKDLQKRWPKMTMETLIAERKRICEALRKKVPELICMTDDEVHELAMELSKE